MRVTLHLEMDAEVFDTSEVAKAEALAESTGGQVYTWKTIGRKNWLEHGYRIVDALALVVLPDSLPESVDMCDDVLEEGTDC